MNSELLKRIKNNDPTLTTVNLSGQNLSEDDMHQFAKALVGNTYIQHLDLSWNPLSDLGLRVLAEALENNKTLKSLNLSKDRDLGLDTDIAIGINILSQALSSNPHLEELNLSGILLGDTGVTGLVKLIHAGVQLKRLGLSNTGLNVDRLPLLLNALESNIFLSSLDISKNLLGNCDTLIGNFLNVTPTLKSLDISSSFLGEIPCIYDALAASSLNSLNLSCNWLGNIEGLCLALLANPNLHHLNLHDTALVRPALDRIIFILENSNLKSLDLSVNLNFMTGSEEAFITALANNKKLQFLNINLTGIIPTEALSRILKSNHTIQEIKMLMIDPSLERILQARKRLGQEATPICEALTGILLKLEKGKEESWNPYYMNCGKKFDRIVTALANLPTDLAIESQLDDPRSELYRAINFQRILPVTLFGKLGINKARSLQSVEEAMSIPSPQP